MSYPNKERHLLLADAFLCLVRVVGLEPTRLAAQEPKSCTSANSAIPAYISGRKNCRYFLLFGTATVSYTHLDVYKRQVPAHVEAVDLFPRTAHVETVALLVKQEALY